MTRAEYDSRNTELVRATKQNTWWKRHDDDTPKIALYGRNSMGCFEYHNYESTLCNTARVLLNAAVDAQRKHDEAALADAMANLGIS